MFAAAPTASYERPGVRLKSDTSLDGPRVWLEPGTPTPPTKVSDFSRTPPARKGLAHPGGWLEPATSSSPNAPAPSHRDNAT